MQKSFDIDYNYTANLSGLVVLIGLVYQHRLELVSYVASGPAGGNSQIIVSATAPLSDLDGFAKAVYSV